MKKKIVLSLLLMILALVLLACGNTKHHQKPLSIQKSTQSQTGIPLKLNPYVKIKKGTGNEWTITLYNKNKVVVSQQTMPTKPVVNCIDKNIIQVSLSLGNPNTYVFFFNVDTGEVSQSYINPRLVQDGKIIYVKDDIVVISDIFDNKRLYKEVKLDLAPAAEKSHVLYELKFIDTNHLMIKYLSGDKYIEKSITVKLI